MKNTLVLFICAVAVILGVASSGAQPAPTVTGSTLGSSIYFIQKPRPLVTLTSAGNYEHSSDASIRILRLTTTELVLECSHWLRYMNSIVLGGDYSTERVYWREYYSIKDGKLTLLRTVNAKVFPKQAEKIEWPEEGTN